MRKNFKCTYKFKCLFFLISNCIFAVLRRLLLSHTVMMMKPALVFMQVVNCVFLIPENYRTRDKKIDTPVRPRWGRAFIAY